MVFASIREHAEHCDFFASTSKNKKNCFASLRATQKFGEHEQASTRLNFASKSTKGKILRAVKNFNGPFVTPSKLDVSAPEPAIQLCDTGQRIPCFNTCQLTKIQVAGYHTSLKSKCVISHCFPMVRKDGQSGGRTITCVPNFLSYGAPL